MKTDIFKQQNMQCNTSKSPLYSNTYVEVHRWGNSEAPLLPGVVLVTSQLPHDAARQRPIGGFVDIECAYTDAIHVVPEGETVDGVASQRQALAHQPGLVPSLSGSGALNEHVVALNTEAHKGCCTASCSTTEQGL